jgi:hypothetical protein
MRPLAATPDADVGLLAADDVDEPHEDIPGKLAVRVPAGELDLARAQVKAQLFLAAEKLGSSPQRAIM